MRRDRAFHAEISFWLPNPADIDSIFLTVDCVTMDVAISAFEKHGLRAQNDKVIGVNEMVQCLATLFEGVRLENQEQLQIALCVDLCLNFLLNLYDT